MKNKFQIKSYHFLLIIGVLVAVILLNLAVSTIAEKMPIKLDLTKNKVFALSDETINVLKGVDRDIDIYYFVTKGKENLYIQQTVDMYKGYSDKIHFTQKDPAQDPTFTKSIGTEITDNSVIVKCGDRTRIIDSATMYDTTYQKQNIVSFELEQKLTRAIDYVLKAIDVNVLFTTGHEEVGYQFLKTPLEDENASPAEVDLKTADIPQNTSILYIAGPQRDFSADEIAKVQAYLAAGGALNISLDYGNDLPVLCQYLSEYWGINYNNDIIMETDTASILMSNPYYLIPKAQEHDITNDIIAGKLSIVWPNARSITISEKAGITTKPLLTTSEKAISKPATEEVSYEVGADEVQMQYTLAAASEYVDSAARTRTRIVACGSSLYAAQMFLSEPSVANSDYLRKSFNYLAGDEISSISVTPKNVAPTYMTLTNEQKTTYMWIYGILPGIVVLVAGLFIWLRRRHK